MGFRCLGSIRPTVGLSGLVCFGLLSVWAGLGRAWACALGAGMTMAMACLVLALCWALSGSVLLLCVLINAFGLKGEGAYLSVSSSSLSAMRVLSRCP